MRGKADGFGDGYSGMRITPAYAGKSAGGSVFTSGTRDHPRLCGEK